MAELNEMRVSVHMSRSAVNCGFIRVHDEIEMHALIYSCTW